MSQLEIVTSFIEGAPPGEVRRPLLGTNCAKLSANLRLSQQLADVVAGAHTAPIVYDSHSNTRD